MKRAIVIVMDGCGAGAAPDAANFNDHDDPSTILHVWEAVGGFHAPNLEALGWLEACGIKGHPATDSNAKFGRLRELSQGKDSVTGHWEMMGVHTKTAFPTYPEGFPIPLIKEFEGRIGTQTIGNCPASGTAIIDRLGEFHVETGFPIVYTSADSVFQIACHEEVVPVEKLYEWCRIARELCDEPDNVQRVIARPFVGEPGKWKRTENRRDFPLPAPKNLVDQIGDVFGVGVVPQLFDGRGFRDVRRTQNNAEHAVMMDEALASDAQFIFANFEDFDMLFGHRNDPKGFAKCIEDFDVFLGNLLAKLTDEDLLIITADHGNDPTSASTDHSREFVPVVVHASGLSGGSVGDVDGMMAIGATVAEHLGVKWAIGQSLI